VRVEGPPRLLYDSVRGGPHRPFLSGGGENGCDASIVHVVYESRQMYPACVIEVEMEMGAEVVAAVRKNSTEGSASAGPAPKRQRHAAPSGGGGGGGGGGSSGGGSSHSAAYVPAAAPPSVAEVRAMGVAAAVAALRAHASVSRVALVACGRLAELCLEAQNRQPAADTGAIEAIVAALQAHPQVVGVQQNGCGAMANVCVSMQRRRSARTYAARSRRGRDRVGCGGAAGAPRGGGCAGGMLPGSGQRVLWHRRRRNRTQTARSRRGRDGVGCGGHCTVF